MIQIAGSLPLAVTDQFMITPWDISDILQTIRRQKVANPLHILPIALLTEFLPSERLVFRAPMQLLIPKLDLHKITDSINYFYKYTKYYYLHQM